MTTKMRLLLAVMVLALTPAAWAGTTSIAWQFGTAHIMSIQSNSLASAPPTVWFPDGPLVDTWQGYVGMEAFYHVSDNLAFGIGGRFTFSHWPLDRTNSFWELDFMGVEYRLFDDIRLRATGGLGKAYEQRAAYGVAYSFALVGPLTDTLDWGIGYMHANVNEEFHYGPPDLESGAARAWTLFLEYRMGR